MCFLIRQPPHLIQPLRIPLPLALSTFEGLQQRLQPALAALVALVVRRLPRDGPSEPLGEELPGAGDLLGQVQAAVGRGDSPDGSIKAFTVLASSKPYPKKEKRN